MSARGGSLRWPWVSLLAAIIFFAVGTTILFVVPSSPIDRTHTISIATPGHVSLPPTAPTMVATTDPGSVTPIASPTR